MSDLDQVLAGEEPVEETPTEEIQPTPEPEVKAEEAPQPAPEPKAEETHMVPLSVVNELRQSNRELKATMERLAPKPEAPKAPDVLDDQQGFVGHVQQQVQSSVQNVKLDMSEAMARESHGAEKVDAAFQALQASNDGAAVQAIKAAPHPYDAMVKWHTQQRVVSEVGSDPEGWMAAKEAEIRTKVEAEMAAKQISDAAAQVTPSLANATGSGGQTDPGWAGPTPLSDLL